MRVEKITTANAHALSLENEIFQIIGRMVVERKQGEWTYTEQLFEEVTAMKFPEELYQLDNIDYAYGAFDGEQCVGLAIFEHHWSAYDYLADLKVSSAYRGQDIGGLLLKAAEEHAVAHGKKGFYTIGQDNNLIACRFYLKHHFVIGGFNTHGYQHTSQQDKADIFFYYDFK